MLFPAQQQSGTQAQHKGFKHTVLAFLGRHKTTFKVTSRVIIGATVISGVVDGGASELAVPEEVAREAALETAVEAETEGTAEEAGAKAVDNLKSIEKAQQRVRSRSDGGKRIIDVIRKSEDRVKNMLNRITQGDYDPNDW